MGRMNMAPENRAILCVMHLQSEHGGRPLSSPHQTRDVMTYNRMEAKPIAGEHCRFCGDAIGAVSEDAVLPAVDMLRYGLCVVSRRRALSGGARALYLVLFPLHGSPWGPWETLSEMP